MDDFRRRPRSAQPPSPTASQQRVGTSGVTASSSTPPRTQSTVPNQPSASTPSSAITPQPLGESSGMSTRPRRFWKKPLFWWIAGPLIFIIALIASALIWYQTQLSPVNSNKTDKQLVTIASGSGPADIAKTLKDDGLIRNESIFLWYARFMKVQNNLQAGTYRLSPSESTPEIVDHLSKGNVDTISITFLPGATLAQNRKALISAGYSEHDVDAAFAKTYDSPLFAGKPASADLEGYIYGETYTFGADATVEEILQRTFDEFYSVVKENNLVSLYSSHGLTLYQGITLASIIQREASAQGDDMPQIAEVFYNRLAQNMPLGSDITYQYIADKMGVPRDPNIDSPYNTRKYPGLPPGPVSTPGKKALMAVATPAVGDYLYFLSGDDGVTYFSRTLDEHEANVKNHCQEKCQIL